MLNISLYKHSQRHNSQKTVIFLILEIKMKSVGRREFLGGALLGGAALLTTGVRAQVARQADARVEVLIDEPIGTISPDLYGHFTEHLGGVIYDGIWVGRNCANWLINEHFDACVSLACHLGPDTGCQQGC